MPIPFSMSMEQSDAIENDAAVLFTCIRAAVHALEEYGEGTTAFGLQNACFKFQESLKGVWSESQKRHQGDADEGNKHFDPSQASVNRRAT